MNAQPRILLFTGEGKGKTTAALGLVFRAAGHGMRACVLQFVKGDDTVGEVAAVRKCGLRNSEFGTDEAASEFRIPKSEFALELHQFGLGFLPRTGSPEETEHRAAAVAGLQKAAEVLAAGQFSVVVLDEICFAVARGLLDEHEVIEAIRRAPAGICVVLTGRYATQGLIDLADTVTEMRPIKHGMTRGIAAQKGVEW